MSEPSGERADGDEPFRARGTALGLALVGHVDPDREGAELRVAGSERRFGAIPSNEAVPAALHGEALIAFEEGSGDAGGISTTGASDGATSGRYNRPPNAFMYSVQLPSAPGAGSPRVAPSDIIIFASRFSISCTKIASGVAGLLAEPNPSETSP